MLNFNFFFELFFVNLFGILCSAIAVISFALIYHLGSRLLDKLEDNRLKKKNQERRMK